MKITEAQLKAMYRHVATANIIEERDTQRRSIMQDTLTCATLRYTRSRIAIMNLELNRRRKTPTVI